MSQTETSDTISAKGLALPGWLLALPALAFLLAFFVLPLLTTASAVLSMLKVI